MAYYLDLFSPETYEAFTRSDQSISGFRTRQENAASRISIGDKLICYMTKLSRWIGVLEVAKVFQELRRPVFSLLEKGPLSDSCTYLAYDSVVELAKEKHLSHLSDSVLDEYAEPAE